MTSTREPGRSREWLPVVATAGGAPLRISVLSVTGAVAGPTLVVVAGVHGDEAVGMEACVRLWERVHPASLAGELLLVPVANPPAFAAWRRRVPHEEVDLNRIFPGRPDGTVSERIAHVVWTLVQGRATFLATLHGWYAVGDCVPHVEIPEDGPVRAASEAAARAAGFALIRLADWHPGLLPAVASRAGIPCMEAEIGGLGAAREDDVALCHDHLQRLMAHLGMTDAPAPGVAGGRAALVRRTHVYAPSGGLLRGRVALGAAVEMGEPLGMITALDLAAPVVVRAPVRGFVATRREALSVEAGDLVATIMTEVG